MTFEQRVLKFIRAHALIDPRGLLLVGVSGGADSMALLTVLNALRHELGVELHALHFNHCLRSEAGRDEQFVQRSCQQLNIPITIGRRTGGAIKFLSEDAARTMRFKFFVKTADHLKAQALALAHTRNDVAETVLMRLMRGSGLYGLRAILPKRSIDGMMVVRPLLETSRLEVEGYLRFKKTSYCTDKTNAKAIYERNRVRHGLLPLLAKEYNPQIVKVLSDLAESAQGDYDFLSLHARAQFEKLVLVSKKKTRIKLKDLQNQHTAIRRLILRLMVEALTGEMGSLKFEQIIALEQLSVPGSAGKLVLPQQLKAIKSKEFLELHISS